MITVVTADEMRELGKRLGAQLRAGDLLILSGPLGAGKTTLVQGIAEGLGVRGPITSPTFVIARVHPSLSGGPALVHADAYRLGSVAELDDLDLDADTDSAVTVVEWGTGLAESLADDRLEIAITRPDPPASAASADAPAALAASAADSLADASAAASAASAADSLAADAIDVPRQVTLTPVGPRWTATPLVHV
jgi:tRNA threonylcarbamoyladenosine biosynthesis protein TsaE